MIGMLTILYKYIMRAIYFFFLIILFLDNFD